eukprot:3704409-Pyramimonas_sp.AAC.1
MSSENGLPWVSRPGDYPKDELCKYAKAAPNINKGKDQLDTQEKATMRKRFMRCVDRMLRNPSCIEGVDGFIEDF